MAGDFEVLNNSNDVDPYLNTADSPKWQTRATGLYNGMLNPLNINISGVIWYQAENNRTNCQLYKKLEPTFINMLRQKFDDEKLPFILTQLPSFNDNDSWRNMRDVQMQNALSDPYSGIAVTVDTGEKNNIHPKDKTKVGQRLALVAAGKFKGVDVEYLGPMLDGINQEGNKLVLSFSHADGLKSGGGELNSFEISADGSTYVAANAVINGEKVEVSADSVTNPRYVRYAYAVYVESRIIFAEPVGLPLHRVSRRVVFPTAFGVDFIPTVTEGASMFAVIFIESMRARFANSSHTVCHIPVVRV